ncbi:MAG: ribosome maturation factor RimM [Lachnospiraceae bacterium]|nr:ribosome maturation factor RimM [Lachnospiraceae bacterium]
MQDYFRVGVIANTHGLRGQVKVYPTTDDVNRFKKLKSVYIDTGNNNYMEVHPQSVSFFKNMVIMGFKEFDNINQIEKFKGMDLLIDRENAIPLEEDEFYIADMINAPVYADNLDEIIAEILEKKKDAKNRRYRNRNKTKSENKFETTGTDISSSESSSVNTNVGNESVNSDSNDNITSDNSANNGNTSDTDNKLKQIGIISDIFDTGANFVIDVKTTVNILPKHILLPLIDECVLELNDTEKYVNVHIMKGLI